MKLKYLLVLVFVFGQISCYTMLKHPNIENSASHYEFSDVQVADDCSSCHSASAYSYSPVLPKGSVNDPNWLFFSQSAWWRDQAVSQNFDSQNYQERTGVRSPQGGYSGSNYGPTATSSAGPSAVPLGKTSNSNVDDNNTDNDNRRTFKRRENVKTESTPRSSRSSENKGRR